MIGRVAELAEARGVTMTEVSLAWLLAKVASPVVGVTKPHHVDGAVRAVDLVLTDEEIAYLESVLGFIDKTESVEEAEAIRQELTETGYLRPRKKSGFKEKKSRPQPMKYRLSKVRMLVVPTATIFPSLRTICSIVSLGTAMISVCILCSLASAVFTGRNVPAPTCSVTSSVSMPRLRRSSSTRSVKCRPAVGAATEPLIRE